MPFENLAALKTGLEIAKAMKTFACSDRPDHRLNDQMCRALRTLYFMPDGILALLRELEHNGGVPSDELRGRLTAFNDREWQVGRALEAIDFEHLRHDLRLSLATLHTLEQIRYGKINLRRDIQNEVNYYKQRGVKPDLKKIRALIAAIENLNAEIEQTERLVNSRALER